MGFEINNIIKKLKKLYSGDIEIFEKSNMVWVKGDYSDEEGVEVTLGVDFLQNENYLLEIIYVSKLLRLRIPPTN